MKHEVNLTKLIEDARRDIADAERCQALHITPATGTLLRRLREVTDALEAGEWEYGSEAIEDDGDGPRPLADDKGLWPDGLGTGVHDPDLALARRIIDRWQNARLIRRRKAGPWEAVPDDRA